MRSVVAMTDDGETTDTTLEAAEAVDDGGETADPFASSLPDCPTCGEPVWVVSIRGPLEGTAAPCGCLVVPGTLERE